MLLLGAESSSDGGSFLVSPSLGLIFWTVFAFTAVALVVFFVGRWLLRQQRERVRGR